MNGVIDPEDSASQVFGKAMLLYVVATFFLMMAILKAGGVK